MTLAEEVALIWPFSWLLDKGWGWIVGFQSGEAGAGVKAGAGVRRPGLHQSSLACFRRLLRMQITEWMTSAQASNVALQGGLSFAALWWGGHTLWQEGTGTLNIG